VHGGFIEYSLFLCLSTNTSKGVIREEKGDQILILIDTDVLIEILDERSKKGEAALEKIEEAREDIALTSLNLHEILFGLYKYANNSNIEKILLLDVTDFTKSDAA
jgi:predicted nucleic acid-binding protein